MGSTKNNRGLRTSSYSFTEHTVGWRPLDKLDRSTSSSVELGPDHEKKESDFDDTTRIPMWIVSLARFISFTNYPAHYFVKIRKCDVKATTRSFWTSGTHNGNSFQGKEGTRNEHPPASCFLQMPYSSHRLPFFGVYVGLGSSVTNLL